LFVDGIIFIFIFIFYFFGEFVVVVSWDYYIYLDECFCWVRMDFGGYSRRRFEDGRWVYGFAAVRVYIGLDEVGCF